MTFAALFAFGFVLVTAYVPNVTGAAIPTGWVVLSLALPFLTLRPITMTPVHWCGLAFFAYASVSVAWSPNVYDSLGSLWLLSLAGGSFVLGSVLSSPKQTRAVYLGLCSGVAVATGIAFAQWLGWNWPDRATGAPAGLFVNSNVFGAICVLGLVIAFTQRFWFFLPVFAAGVALSHFRTGLVALAAAGVVWLWGRTRLGAIAAILGAALLVSPLMALKGTGSIDHRLAYWSDTAEALTPFGYGVGSFFNLYPTIAKRTDVVAARPDHVYNDYLELIFEFGLGTIPLWAMFILSLEKSNEPERLILVAFLAMASFYFVSFYPITTFVGLFASGVACRNWNLVRAYSGGRGQSVHPRMGHLEPATSSGRLNRLPLQLGHPGFSGSVGTGAIPVRHDRRVAPQEHRS